MHYLNADDTQTAWLHQQVTGVKVSGNSVMHNLNAYRYVLG